MSESPDHYGSALVRDPGSPVGAESSRVHQQHYHPHHPQSLHHAAHPPQQRDREGARQTQPYVQPQPYPTPTLPNQQQQQQRQALANQPPAGQPQSPTLAQQPSVQEVSRICSFVCVCVSFSIGFVHCDVTSQWSPPIWKHGTIRVSS